MRIENNGSCRPTIADSASVVLVTGWPMIGATSPPSVTTGMPIDPKATGAVFASSASTAAVTGSKPRLARIDAVMATGAPNPAIPSSSAPNENATRSVCSRRSVVRRVSDRLMTSKSPLATVRLWKKTALSTIQLMGQRPNAMPSVAVPTEMPNGMPQISQPRTNAVSIAASAQSHAGRRSTARATKRT